MKSLCLLNGKLIKLVNLKLRKAVLRVKRMLNAFIVKRWDIIKNQCLKMKADLKPKKSTESDKEKEESKPNSCSWKSLMMSRCLGNKFVRMYFIFYGIQKLVAGLLNLEYVS
ncbi:hypothetical protein O6H91_Y555300 [Diphasiastrum complanatum]|nr:hypothetical protein O6H91_Y555300 [Diphasiastrum complanatum]